MDHIDRASAVIHCDPFDAPLPREGIGPVFVALFVMLTKPLRLRKVRNW